MTHIAADTFQGGSHAIDCTAAHPKVAAIASVTRETVGRSTKAGRLWRGNHQARAVGGSCAPASDAGAGRVVTRAKRKDFQGLALERAFSPSRYGSDCGRALCQPGEQPAPNEVPPMTGGGRRPGYRHRASLPADGCC